MREERTTDDTDSTDQQRMNDLCNRRILWLVGEQLVEGRLGGCEDLDALFAQRRWGEQGRQEQ